MSSDTVEFNLPGPLKDFIFDLHDAMRRSRRPGEVQKLYEVRAREITEKYFSNSPWPDVKIVSAEVKHDEKFLLFYKEMTVRHLYASKIKPQMSDHIASWTNYLKLFEFVINAAEDELCITTQWIYDITQEFAYQFQGFCQFRSQVGNHNAEILKFLEANRDLWNYPTVDSVLNRLIKAGKLKNNGVLLMNRSSFQAQFGYFASIELARLQCLIGDYNASFTALADIKLTDRSELFMQLTLCHFNVCYHNGICNMMLRRFAEAADVFGEIILLVSRILKPGAAAGLRPGLPAQLQKLLDKVLSLNAIVITLNPSHRIEDQVKNLIESKYSDKLRKLQSGDLGTFKEFFENSAPKFVSPLVPDYSVKENCHFEMFNYQVSIFITEVEQHIPFLKLRSFLTLYASIDISKLARFNDSNDVDLKYQLISFKNKAIQNKLRGKPNLRDIHFYINNDVLFIDSGVVSAQSESNKLHEKYFIAGVRKHSDINYQMLKTFNKLGI